MVKDFIYHAKNTLTLEECESLIHFYESNEEYHEDGTMGVGEVDHNKKKCSEMYISTNSMHSESEYFSSVNRSLIDNIGKYKKDYPFLERLFVWDVSSHFKIKKYLPKEAYFEIHCENSGHRNGCGERRMIAWMIYLNDVTDGGETEFPTQCKKFAPRAGDVLVWPAYWTHPHRGIVSPTQTKYIVTGWYSFTEDTDAIKH